MQTICDPVFPARQVRLASTEKPFTRCLALERFPGTDTVRHLFMRFRQGHIEEFWRPLWKWLLALSWPQRPEGFSLDLDSTVFQRSGNQDRRSCHQSHPEMNNQAAKLVKTTAQLSLKFIQLRISGVGKTLIPEGRVW